MGARWPDFVVIGAMKAGTSTLHEQLGLRSRIFMSTPKEPNFFSDDEHFQRGVDWYTALFAGARSDQICGESSTHYTKRPTHPRTVERMRRLLPEARFIYVLRHPVERMVSQYIHEWTCRTVTGSLERAVRSQERFLAYSRYAFQLEPYLEVFGPDRVLLVTFERLLAYPDAELARICRFLADPSPEPFRWSVGLAPRNVSRERLRRSAWRDALLSRRWVRAAKAWLPRSWRNAAKQVWQMRRRPELSPTLRNEVEQRIDEDLVQLGSWLGMELTCRNWGDRVVRTPLEWATRGGAAS